MRLTADRLRNVYQIAMAMIVVEAFYENKEKCVRRPLKDKFAFDDQNILYLRLITTFNQRKKIWLINTNSYYFY